MTIHAASSCNTAPQSEAQGLIARVARAVARLAIYYVAALLACAAYAHLAWAVLKDPTLVTKTLRQLREGKPTRVFAAVARYHRAADGLPAARRHRGAQASRKSSPPTCGASTWRLRPMACGSTPCAAAPGR